MYRYILGVLLLGHLQDALCVRSSLKAVLHNIAKVFNPRNEVCEGGAGGSPGGLLGLDRLGWVGGPGKFLKSRRLKSLTTLCSQPVTQFILKDLECLNRTCIRISTCTNLYGVAIYHNRVPTCRPTHSLQTFTT